ncbi:MAG: hypothetical protein R3F17_14160 [Planctomycetota bacterium]
MLLRPDMRFKDLEDIRQYPIGNGQVLGDVAEVIRAKSVRDWLSRVDGKRAYYGMVQRESNANVVETARGIQDPAGGTGPGSAPGGKLEIVTLFDQGR